MLTLIYRELLLFRRSVVLWLMILLLVLQLLITLLKADSGSWQHLMDQTYMNLWFRPTFFTFLAGYLFTRDQDHGMLSLHKTYPFHWGEWYTAKIFTSLLLIGMLLFGSELITLVIGLWALDVPVSAAALCSWFIKDLVVSWIIYAGFLAYGAVLALISRTSLYLTIVLLGQFLLGLVLIIRMPDQIIYYPWLVPSIYLHGTGKGTWPDQAYPLVIYAVLGVMCLVWGGWMYRRLQRR